MSSPYSDQQVQAAHQALEKTAQNFLSVWEFLNLEITDARMMGNFENLASDIINKIGLYGFVIVPAGDVLAPEDRAAVGRLVAFFWAYVNTNNAERDWIDSDDDEYVEALAAFESARDRRSKAFCALEMGDIEAAQRVAGGGNG